MSFNFGPGDAARFDRNKVIYLQIPPISWIPKTPFTDEINYENVGGIASAYNSGASTYSVYALVNLKHEAEILSITVYGTSFVWILQKIAIATGVTTTIATGSENQTITLSGANKQIINNQDFSYQLKIASFTPGQEIYGSTIVYTLPIDFADQQERI